MLFSRRRLISTATAGTVATLFSTQVYAQEKKINWTDKTQVLIVGAGFAGLCAAISAARAGAKVLLIDKRLWMGGDGLMSAGQFWSSRTPYHDKAGITKNVEREDYWKQMQAGTDDEPLSKVRDNLLFSPIYSGINKHNPEVIKRAAYYSPEVIDFVASFGIEFMPLNKAKPFQVPTVNGSMSKFVKGMVKELDTLKIKVLLGVRATDLIVDDKGAVIGVTAKGITGKNKGKDFNIKACSTVLCTGGFLNNDYLMKRYKRFWSKAPTGFTNIGEGVADDHTGDGIIMGKKVGAAVEDMESMPKFYACPKKGVPGISWILFDVDTGYLVNKQGKRMLNEHQARYSGCALKLMQTNTDGGYLIFGEDTFQGGNRNRWMFDKALAGGGLFRADSAEELAKKVGVDPEGLKQTINKINEDAKKGVDTEFGRTDALFKPLRAPFYITPPSYPVRYKTEGGLEVNPDFKVIKASDETEIPGLFSAGSTVGSISTRLGDVVASGLIVGPIAAAAAKNCN